MLYDPGNLIWPEIEENPAAICLILLVFAGWHAVTNAREIPRTKGHSWHICGKDISTIEDKKFWGNQAESPQEK